MIEFVDLEISEPTEAQKKLAEYTRAHWRVCDDNGSLEWIPCGPNCTHSPETVSEGQK